MSAGRLAAVLSLLVGAACDTLMTEPADQVAATDVRFSLEVASGEVAPYGDLSEAFDGVRSVWFRFIHDGVARDTVIGAAAMQDSVRTRALLRSDEARGWLEIQVELRMGDGSALFRGRTLVQSYRVSPVVRIELTPVVADILAPGLPGQIPSLGDTVVLEGRPRFANGALLEGLTVAWTSDAPVVLGITAADRAVSRSPGSAMLTASALGTTSAFPIEVRQVAEVLTGVGPADTTVTLGATYQARPFGVDGNGFPLLPGAFVQWDSDGAVQVDPNGLVTAVTSGAGVVRATAGGETRSAQVTVTP